MGTEDLICVKMRIPLLTCVGDFIDFPFSLGPPIFFCFLSFPPQFGVGRVRQAGLNTIIANDGMSVFAA